MIKSMIIALSTTLLLTSCVGETKGGISDPTTGYDVLIQDIMPDHEIYGNIPNTGFFAFTFTENDLERKYDGLIHYRVTIYDQGEVFKDFVLAHHTSQFDLYGPFTFSMAFTYPNETFDVESRFVVIDYDIYDVLNEGNESNNQVMGVIKQYLTMPGG
jgi:hypothetical protein